MIIITGHVIVKEEDREAALALGCEHSARSREEQGCLAHNCFVDAENERRIHFFEKWADAAAVNAHFALPASRQFMMQMSGYASSDPVIEVFAAEKLDAAAL